MIGNNTIYNHLIFYNFMIKILIKTIEKPCDCHTKKTIQRWRLVKLMKCDGLHKHYYNQLMGVVK